MKVALLKNTKTITYEDVDYRKPDAGFLTIDTQSTGICGSDLHRYHGSREFSDKAGGHELSGIVKDVGEGVTRFQHGDRVIVEAIASSGSPSFEFSCQTEMAYRYFTQMV
jgi:threonine dehydrogenase-like Zn-dependent dehydrogenase